MLLKSKFPFDNIWDIILFHFSSHFHTEKLRIKDTYESAQAFRTQDQNGLSKLSLMIFQVFHHPSVVTPGLREVLLILKNLTAHLCIHR